MNPYAAPQATLEAPPTDALQALARAHRFMTVGLLGGLIVFIAGSIWVGSHSGIGPDGVDAPHVLAPIAALGLQLGVRAWCGYLCWRLATALGSPARMLWTIGGAFLMLFVAVPLTWRAGTKLRAGGVRIGLLGAVVPD